MTVRLTETDQTDRIMNRLEIIYCLSRKKRERETEREGGGEGGGGRDVQTFSRSGLCYGAVGVGRCEPDLVSWAILQLPLAHPQ